MTGFQAGFAGSKNGSLGDARRSAALRSSDGRGKAQEYAAVVVGRVEDAELHPQGEIAEQLGGVEEQTQPAAAVAHHFTVDMHHAAATGAGQVPVLEGLRRSVEQRTETGFDAADTASGLGKTLAFSRPALRRPSATPVSIGFGEPTVGNSAGPAT